MQVSFNPQKSYSPNFKALSPAQIAEHTKSLHDVTNFKTDIVRGAIKLDDTDRANLTALYDNLKRQGDVAISFVLDKILKIK